MAKYLDCQKDFGPFEGQAWLNAASEGAMAHAAAAGLAQAQGFWQKPWTMAADSFERPPLELKGRLAALLGASPKDLVLGSSSSYGAHLLANGLPWRAGDQIITIAGDFPVNILPWLGLVQQGVEVVQLDTGGGWLSPAQLERAITPRTRLACFSWVHSFTGQMADLAALSDYLAQRGIWRVVNATQGLGGLAWPDAPQKLADAVICSGHKWLLGPFGTGFAWISPQLAQRLSYNQAYWALMAPALEEAGAPVALKTEAGLERYDQMGAAHFLSHLSWTAALDYLLARGIPQVEAHNRALNQAFVKGLDAARYSLPWWDNPTGAAFPVFGHRQPQRNPQIHKTLQQAGLHLSLRRGWLRLSPHLYNSPQEIDRLLELLNRL